MSKAITAVLVAWGLALSLGRVTAGAAEAPAEAAGPEQVVRTYLESLQKGEFARAYDQLTPQMTREQPKERWVAEQAAVMKLGEVEIRSFQVFPARPEGEGRVKVPNLLKSKDKYINQTGADEYELYTVVRGEDGRWRIDQQELVETDNVSKWFPKDAAK